MGEELKVTEESAVEKELSNIERLLEYEKQGYVFHGSPRKGIEIIEPSLARDRRVGKDFNNDTAVFAAQEAAESIIYTCVRSSIIPDELGEDRSWGVSNSGTKPDIVARIPIKWKQYVEKSRGYVYVLDSESFTRKRKFPHGQVKSKEPVKPVDVIEVEFSDFEKLGGAVEWKED